MQVRDAGFEPVTVFGIAEVGVDAILRIPNAIILNCVFKPFEFFSNMKNSLIFAKPVVAISIGIVATLGTPILAAERQPNVVIILTDDQGFGELGATGNPVVRTPNIDRFAKQCVSLLDFHVQPVCSPTRAGLMTGRDYYRTAVTDTYMGRSLMDPNETTIAQMFAGAGYHTGIFGKWHLGDTYPRRPMDKGFQESLVLNGGGLSQPGDPPDPWDERGAYFNPWLRHNGAWERTKGYVSDILTTAAMDFIEMQKGQPFLVYLPFNCPHAPHEVPAKYLAHYPPQVFAPANFPSRGHPMPAEHDAKQLAAIYGMIENIDENVARLLAKLDELKLADNTIVVLFSDNGCQAYKGYNAGFLGYKGSPYEGGTHQFCFVRWPAQLQAGRTVDRLAANIDLTPTLLDLCGVAKPGAVKFDGVSLAPLLRGEKADWPDRNLFFQWHRGDVPQRYQNCAVRSQNWKLVQALGGPKENGNGQKQFELFDMMHDPLEMHDVAAEHPDQVAHLKAAYDAWFDELNRERDFRQPQTTFVGTRFENPVLLTQQDAHPSSSKGRGIFYWDLNITSAARYDIKLLFAPVKGPGTAQLDCAGVSVKQPLAADEKECEFKNILLPAGTGRFEAILSQGAANTGIKYAEIKMLD
jgi:arylsulfatase A-like enzyme